MALSGKLYFKVYTEIIENKIYTVVITAVTDLESDDT